MSAFAWNSQQALYAKLSAGLLSPLVGVRIYDAPPQPVGAPIPATEFPYVEIGDRQVIPDDAAASTGGSDDGVSDFFDLHIWSRHQGKKEIAQITDVLHTMLHGQTLTVSGRASALSWIRSVRTIRDPDGITQHGIVNVEIIHRT